MMFVDVLQLLASILTLVGAILYVIGFFIVNVHLDKYRFAEYQLFSTSYLVAGGRFLLDLMMTLTLPSVAALFAAAFTAAFTGIESNPVSIIGMLFAVSISLSQLVWIGIWYRSRMKLNHLKSVAPALHSLAFIYPLSVFLRLITSYYSDFVTDLEISVAQITIVLAVTGFTLDYAWRIYGTPLKGREGALGAAIGRGAPQVVLLAGKQDDLAQLAALGIQTGRVTTEDIYLIGETDKHYIVTTTLSDDAEAIKISKDLIGAIRYKKPQEND